MDHLVQILIKMKKVQKGLKCSSNETDLLLNITGGTFVLNTADDSIHSDGNINITWGTFEISSGDDGVHADQYLILGKENVDNSLIDLKVTKSYEGLEGSYIYIYSGTYNIVASDDGINSAGDTDEECEQGGNGNQPGGRASGFRSRRIMFYRIITYFLTRRIITNIFITLLFIFFV